LFHFIAESIPFETRTPIEIRLFPINSLHFQEFFKNVQNSNYLLGTQSAELLESGFRNRRFQQPGAKIKTKWKKTKKLLRAQHGDLVRSGKGSCGIQSPECQELCAAAAAAYVSIRLHTSAYVSIRQHTSAYVSIRQHTSAYVSVMRGKCGCSCSTSHDAEA
jgi:hypothetical protein